MPLQNPRAAHHSEIRPRFTAITGVGSGSSSKQSSEHWIVVYVVCRCCFLCDVLLPCDVQVEEHAALLTARSFQLHFLPASFLLCVLGSIEFYSFLEEK